MSANSQKCPSQPPRALRDVFKCLVLPVQPSKTSKMFSLRSSKTEKTRNKQLLRRSSWCFVCFYSMCTCVRNVKDRFYVVISNLTSFTRKWVSRPSSCCQNGITAVLHPWCVAAATVWWRRATTFKQVAYLHVSVEFLHELLLLLLGHINLLHVVPEVHVLEGGKLFSL